MARYFDLYLVLAWVMLRDPPGPYIEEAEEQKKFAPSPTPIDSPLYHKIKFISPCTVKPPQQRAVYLLFTLKSIYSVGGFQGHIAPRAVHSHLWTFYLIKQPWLGGSQGLTGCTGTFYLLKSIQPPGIPGSCMAIQPTGLYRAM